MRNTKTKITTFRLLNSIVPLAKMEKTSQFKINRQTAKNVVVIKPPLYSEKKATKPRRSAEKILYRRSEKSVSFNDIEL